MNVYHYDAVTGEYLGSEKAQPNPLEPGKFLIPANSTGLAPPTLNSQGGVLVFSNERWSELEDRRGVPFWLEDGSQGFTSDIKGTLPEGASFTQPEESATEKKARMESAVRDESLRRLMDKFGARDSSHLAVKITEAMQAAIELIAEGEENWTDEQRSYSDYLKTSRQSVKDHDTSSKTLRAMDPIPDDYADDKYWPPVTPL